MTALPNPHALPLLSALQAAAIAGNAPFHTPGHQQGAGTPAPLRHLLGAAALAADLPELPELDNLFAPSGAIQAAQDLAAIAFGAEATYFLANGSTCGLQAALLATCGPGDRVLVPRNAHRSVQAGLILCGATPVYGHPHHHADWDLAWGLGASQVAAALAAAPDIQTVVVVSPNYQGICSDIGAIAAVVHKHGATLIVDEAHGAHLAFHPDLPNAALGAGADVVVQSTHKTLSALTQAAMLHVQGPRIDRDRLRQALGLTQSTSPNYLLLASLDAARHQMAHQGREHLERTLGLAHHARAALATMGIPVMALPSSIAGDVAEPTELSALFNGDRFTLDPTRLTVHTAALGLSGFDADDRLHTHHGVTAELPTLRQLSFILSLGSQPQHVDALVQGFRHLSTAAHEPAGGPVPTAAIPTPAPPLSQPPLSPRDAFYRPHRSVPWGDAIGAISADALCPYPPGIPVVLPGERITATAIAQLQALQAAGGILTGAADPTLATLRIVEG